MWMRRSESRFCKRVISDVAASRAPRAVYAPLPVSVVAAALIDPASTALTRLLASSLHARLLPTQQNGSPTDAAAADGAASCAQCGSTSQPAQPFGRFQPAAACAGPQNGTDDRCVGEARQVRAQGPTACCFGEMSYNSCLLRALVSRFAPFEWHVLEVLRHRLSDWRLLCACRPLTSSRRAWVQWCAPASSSAAVR